MNTRISLTAFAIIFTAAVGNSFVTGAAWGGELNETQQQTILREANALYEKGTANAEDRALSKEAYEAAAAKYQTLVDDGVHNWRMYFNLGNAYLQSGSLGRAVANYQRAAALTGDPAVHANLAHAKSLVKTEAAPVAQPQTTMEMASERLDAIPQTFLLTAAAIAWAGFWLVMSVGRAKWRRPAKAFAVVSAVVFMSAVIIMAGRDSNSQQPLGIITANEGVLREGNGSAFKTKEGSPLAEGMEVQVLEQRGDWLNVQLQDGRTGWLAETQVEVI